MLTVIERDSCDGADNLAYEEALFADARGWPRPLLLFYVNDPCVVLGRANPEGEWVDRDACERDGVPVLRRFSGGGTVYHDRDNLNYSFIVPRGMLDELIRGTMDSGTGAIARGKSTTILPSVEDFRRYRRDLPHWRQSGPTYWLTWRLHPSHAGLPGEARDITVAALRHLDGEQYRLIAYVVMDDHVHVIVEPLPGFVLEKIVQAWKSVSAHRINKTLGWTGAVWMPEYFDRIIRDEEELIQKCEYTLNNPLKRWPDQFGYKWVYCSFLEKTVPSFATGDGARATVPIATSAPGTSQQPGVHAYIAFFRQLIIRALSPLAAEFTETGLSDISFKGHKVSGNAQRIASNIVLHHGTLMLRCPLEAIERYLPVPPNRPGVPHRGFVGGLQELGLDCGMGEIKALIAAEFRRSL